MIVRLTTFAILAFLLSSCGKDLCDRVPCGLTSHCDRGSCECNEGYRGYNCDSSWMLKYAGTYFGTTSRSNGQTVIDTVEISLVSMPYQGMLVYKAEKETLDLQITSPINWYVDPDYHGDSIYASAGVTFEYPSQRQGMKGTCVRTINNQITESWYFVGYK